MRSNRTQILSLIISINERAAEPNQLSFALSNKLLRAVMFVLDKHFSIILNIWTFPYMYIYLIFLCFVWLLR
jgi:hypothetical protein